MSVPAEIFTNFPEILDFPEDSSVAACRLGEKYPPGGGLSSWRMSCVSATRHSSGFRRVDAVPAARLGLIEVVIRPADETGRGLADVADRDADADGCAQGVGQPQRVPAVGFDAVADPLGGLDRAHGVFG